MGNGDVGIDREVRARILDGAVRVMASEGFRRTTVPAIVEAAEVGESEFHQHFAGKEECFLAIFEETVDDVGRLVAESVEGRGSWVDRTAAAIEACLEAVAADPDRALLCLSEAHVVGGPAVARYDSLVRQVSAQLRQGRDQRDCKHEAPEDLEFFLVNGVAAIVQRRLEQRRSGWISDVLPEVQRFVLCPFIGDSDSQKHLSHAL